MSKVREIFNLNDLQSFYDENVNALHIVKIGAPWCGPCRTLSNILENIEEDKIGSTMICEVDIDVEGADTIVSKYNVRSVPVTLFVKNGELLEKKVGTIPADFIYNKIEEYK